MAEEKDSSREPQRYEDMSKSSSLLHFYARSTREPGPLDCPWKRVNRDRKPGGKWGWGKRRQVPSLSPGPASTAGPGLRKDGDEARARPRTKPRVFLRSEHNKEDSKGSLFKSNVKALGAMFRIQK